MLIERATLDSPDVQALISELNAELRGQYPEPGANHFRLDAGDVDGVRGVFLIGLVDGRPVACGAIRQLDDAAAGPGAAEVKRMYVRRDMRGKGLGRAMLAALEREARTLGFPRVVLETGTRQHEAIELYESSGFERIPLYGEYLGSPATSLCFGKRLR
jgi:GNAT superfamily N-acetyltransferase